MGGRTLGGEFWVDLRMAPFLRTTVLLNLSSGSSNSPKECCGFIAIKININIRLINEHGYYCTRGKAHYQLNRLFNNQKNCCCCSPTLISPGTAARRCRSLLLLSSKAA